MSFPPIPRRILRQRCSFRQSAAALGMQKGKPVRAWLEKNGRGGKTVCVIKGW
ncbi:MAG: hypothetical protein R3A10_21140 [Caldilineaceae bacterium]